MKNKEIKELLNELKDEDDYIEEYGYSYKRIALDDCWLLLSYIEQLEKRNKELYEGFMATQEELTDYATKNEQLEADYKEANESITWWTNRYNAIVKQNDDNHKKVVKLENNRDKAIEILNKWEKENINPVFRKGLLKILKGDSDE